MKEYRDEVAIPITSFTLRIAGPQYYSLLEKMKGISAKRMISSALAATLCTGTLLGVGDGTGEPGFVPPPREKKKPPAPPRTASSAETLLACCCCPVAPMSRTEAKKPPQPPVIITKLKDERAGGKGGKK